MIPQFFIVYIMAVNLHSRGFETIVFFTFEVLVFDINPQLCIYFKNGSSSRQIFLRVSEMKWIRSKLLTIVILLCLKVVLKDNASEKLYSYSWDIFIVVHLILDIILFIELTLYLFNNPTTNLGNDRVCSPSSNPVMSFMNTTFPHC